MTVTLQKQKLREEIKAVLKKNSPQEKAKQSRLICEQLTSILSQQKFQTIGVFAPLASEPDIWPVIEMLWNEGKIVVFPRVEGERLEFYRVSNRSELISNDFKILEPRRDQTYLFSLSQIEIFLVPGLAFDNKGNRLGRSGGLYDRLLADPDCQAEKIGICFAQQILPKIPIERHDQKVDQVISSKTF